MAKAELAIVAGEVSVCDQKIAIARTNVRDLLGDQRQTNDMNHVKLFSQLTTSEQVRIDDEMAKRKLFQAEMERHSAYVAFLHSELKSVEHHESAQREEHKKSADKHEAKVLDEVSGLVWNRKMRTES